MELRILIFGLVLLVVHQTESAYVKDIYTTYDHRDGSRNTDVHNLLRVVRQYLQYGYPNAFILVINGTDIKIYNIDIQYDDNFPNVVLAMSGIEWALRHSLTDTRLWVFIGEPASDHAKYHDVVYLSQKMGNQIYFAIFGPRYSTTPDYSVYHDVAAATNGQVFYFQKVNEIEELLRYEDHFTVRPKDVVAAKTFAPALEGNEFSVTFDNKTSKLIIAVTDEDEKPDVTVSDSSGLQPSYTAYVTRELSAITVVELHVSPGVYTVRVSSPQETRVVVTASTSLTFRHGFSAHTPSDFNETTRIPLQGPNHLSILLDNADGLELRSVQILDMEYTVLVEAPVKSVSVVAQLYYTTEPITIPDQTFLIAIKIHDPSSGTNLTRHGSTPITRIGKCQQPREDGPCEDVLHRWFHNNTIKECRQFPSDRCGTNENRFTSEADCNRDCGAPAPPEPPAPVIDKCLQPKDEGPCWGFTQSWYYDDTIKECRQFIYGGCGGNANRFTSEKQCRSGCGLPAAPVPPTPVKGICQQPMDPGPCAATIPKWYYDSNLKECRQFIYGGCMGNENRFRTETECRRVCDVPAPPVPPTPLKDTCQQPVDGGPCRDEIPMWNYDNDLKECHLFTYGGCGGNHNRFGSEEDCYRECGAPPVAQEPIIDKCQQPMKARGPCRGEFPKWYYNYRLKTCRMFTYGGCGGNDNRFSSDEECYRECGAPAPPAPQMPIIDKCQQPKDPGSCGGTFQKWYYDNKLKMCLAFPYSGCGGNDNRFDTGKECRRHCDLPINLNTTEHENHELAATEKNPNMQKNETWQRDDDLETFVRYVASSLRKFNDTIAINAQDEIQAILSKYKLRNLEKTYS